MGTTTHCDFGSAGQPFDPSTANRLALARDLHPAEAVVQVTTKAPDDAEVRTAAKWDACSDHLPQAVGEALSKLDAVEDGFRLEVWYLDAVGGGDTRAPA